MNGGKCIGNNTCRCPPGLGGNHCEIGRHQRSTCKKPCRHGLCLANHTCRCNEGWFGRYCNQSNNFNVNSQMNSFIIVKFQGTNTKEANPNFNVECSLATLLSDLIYIGQ